MGNFYTPFFLVVSLLIGLPAQAQIVINRNDMPGLGDTIRITNTDASSIDVNVTGADHAWDFSGLSSGSQAVLDYKNILQTPYFLFFPSLLTFGIRIPDIGFGAFSFTDMYNFFLIDNNEYSNSGIGLKFQGAPFAAAYSKNDRIYNFPLRYNDADSTNFAVTVDLPGIGKYKSSGYRKTVVDGWGEVTTPYGTFNCLRVKARRNATDSITVNVFGLNFAFGIPNDSWEYQWLAKGQKVPVLSIEGRYVSSSFIITRAYYRGVDTNIPSGITPRHTTATWKAFPNPGHGSWTLTADPIWAGATVRLYNMQGQEIRTTALAGNAIYLDMAGQSAGTYMVQLEKGERREITTMILGR